MYYLKGRQAVCAMDTFDVVRWRGVGWPPPQRVLTSLPQTVKNRPCVARWSLHHTMGSSGTDAMEGTTLAGWKHWSPAGVTASHHLQVVGSTVLAPVDEAVSTSRPDRIGVGQAVECTMYSRMKPYAFGTFFLLPSQRRMPVFYLMSRPIRWI